MTDQNCFVYEHPQFGAGLAYYRPSILRQRGSGLGGIFGSVFRRLIPFARDILLPAAKKYVLPHAEEAIGNIAGDLINGRSNIKDSLKANGITALKKIGKSVLDQSGSGRPKKRKRSTNKSCKTKKSKTTNSKRKNLKKQKSRITIF